MAKQHWLLIYEGKELIPLHAGAPTYRVGPYKSHEEADDAYFVGCFHVKPDFDSEGCELFWDYDIETEGEDDDPSDLCAC